MSRGLCEKQFHLRRLFLINKDCVGICNAVLKKLSLEKMH